MITSKKYQITSNKYSRFTTNKVPLSNEKSTNKKRAG